VPSTLESGNDLTVKVNVENIGDLKGDEVVQVYVQNTNADEFNPHKTLASFERVSFAPGEKKTLTFTIDKEQLSSVNANGEKVMLPGAYNISVGGAQPSEKRIKQSEVLVKKLTVTRKLSK